MEVTTKKPHLVDKVCHMVRPVMTYIYLTDFCPQLQTKMIMSDNIYLLLAVY